MSHSNDGSDQNSGQNFGAGVSQPSRKKSTSRSQSSDKPRGDSSGKPERKPRGPRRRDSAERPRRRERETEAREPREVSVAVAPEPKRDLVEDYVQKINTDAETTVAGFEVFDLGKRINRAIDEAGYKSPRPIQAETIQPILDGRDILGLAQTGTGKTAAFVLPILHHLLNGGRPGNYPRILVISPTRELTNQIHGEFEALGKYTGVKSMTVFGGVGVNPQIRALRGKPDVMVACPGRLLDLVSRGAVRLSGVEILVLDEADHMFDMGFLPDVRKVISYLPKRRQNLLFSATMPKEIRHLTKEVLTDPVVVELNHQAPVETIEHKLFPVHPTRKGDLLQHMVCEDGFRSAIVFTRTKYRAKNLAKKLGRDGHRAVALQGNMSQPQRDRAMAGFKDGTYEILVATDIAARGIDVAGVSHVINFDIPGTPEAYMHRIGRTGRSEQEGKACTYITKEDFSQVKAIEKKLGVAIPRVKLEDFAVGAKGGDQELVRGGGGGGGQSRRSGGFKPGKGGRGAGQPNKRRGGHRRGR